MYDLDSCPKYWHEIVFRTSEDGFVIMPIEPFYLIVYSVFYLNVYFRIIKYPSKMDQYKHFSLPKGFFPEDGVLEGLPNFHQAPPPWKILDFVSMK
jgi:hypothetical protein